MIADTYTEIRRSLRPESKGEAAAIDAARRAVERAYSCKSGDRKWLVGSAPDSYSSAYYRTQIHVLEGSPPKGYVLVASHGETFGVAVALDCGEEKISNHWWGDGC